MTMARTALRSAPALLFAMFVLAACSGGVDEHDPAMTRYVLEHDGIEREYFVFLPSSYDGKQDLPVAIFMHGYGGTATGTEAEVTQGLNFYAEKFGYVMVYPQSTWFMAGDSPETAWEATSWNHISDGFDKGPDGPICTEDADDYPCPPECGTCGKCGWASCNDDVGFLEKLVATVATNLAVDSQRFYVSGFSNGAMMTHRIACDASHLFAAVALIGGRVEPGFECMPQNKRPLLQINGGQDLTVPHDGSVSSSGYFFADTRSVTAHWLGDEACAATSAAWSSPTIDNENVQCSIACAASDHEVIDCIWPEGNHRWPGTADFRGSNGYCVTELQAASMPGQTLCIAPDPEARIWGSQLLFEFFNEHQGN
jgi:polyhydroxybutyrate depolymerase